MASSRVRSSTKPRSTTRPGTSAGACTSPDPEGDHGEVEVLLADRVGEAVEQPLPALGALAAAAVEHEGPVAQAVLAAEAARGRSGRGRARPRRRSRVWTGGGAHPVVEVELGLGLQPDARPTRSAPARRARGGRRARRAGRVAGWCCSGAMPADGEGGPEQVRRHDDGPEVVGHVEQVVEETGGRGARRSSRPPGRRSEGTSPAARAASTRPRARPSVSSTIGKRWTATSAPAPCGRPRCPRARRWPRCSGRGRRW